MDSQFLVKNLIDILKTKTFVIDKQKNKLNIEFDGFSYKSVTSEEIKNMNDFKILNTKINDTQVSYYIYNHLKVPDIITGENVYPLPIIVLNNTQNKKIVNVYNKETLCIHYPTVLQHFNLSIKHINDNIIVNELKPSLDSSNIEYKIFHHPTYLNNLKYLGYTRNNNNIFKSTDFRKCIN